MTRTVVNLSNAEQWYAEGAEVFELEYLGHGHYAGVRTTVERVTASQIITATGRRFWRRRSGRGLVGQATKRLANRIRIVPLDNPHAAALIRNGEAQA